jgi:hypothetical protein
MDGASAGAGALVRERVVLQECAVGGELWRGGRGADWAGRGLGGARTGRGAGALARGGVHGLAGMRAYCEGSSRRE